MKCVVCGKPVEHKLVKNGSDGMHPWCSDECDAKWRTRNEFLFKVNEAGPSVGEKLVGIAINSGYLDDDVNTLVRLNQVSKSLRPLAKEHELGGTFTKDATHVQQKPTGIVTVAVTPNAMLEIALMAYNTAVELKALNLPVILYRVAAKGTLTSDEKKRQTLSSSVHASVGGTEVWPLEKTAAWIQGAMRARVSFVLLNDPRRENALVGGVDKRSDAVYVRELHQITSTRYQIEVAPNDKVPRAMYDKRIFILSPPEVPIGPLPLVPKISRDMWSGTWDASKSELALGDPVVLIREHLVQMFTKAGTELGVPEY